MEKNESANATKHSLVSLDVTYAIMCTITRQTKPEIECYPTGWASGKYNAGYYTERKTSIFINVTKLGKLVHVVSLGGEKKPFRQMISKNVSFHL